MNQNILKESKKIHFVGIGGIGVSAIARMMLLEGKLVNGSDRSLTDITNSLEALGAKIYAGHDENNLDNDTDLVIFTPAISGLNPEINKAKELGITAISYPEALGLVSGEKFTIAVSGTHGKTTTTAMIGKILIDAELEPTIIVGSLPKDFGSNFTGGNGKYLVCEACEYKRSFLNINPKIVVITNIDSDHLDYYKDLDDIKSAFSEFALRAGEDGSILINGQDKNSSEVVAGLKNKAIDFSTVDADFTLKVIGEHNKNNAKAALTVARSLGVSDAVALKSLSGFSGTWRRFEYKGKSKNDALVYDDYAHHPTEIKASLKGAREHFKNSKIFCVFQPHLYSRTKLLADEFAGSFDDADFVIMPDIYAAREKDDESINSRMIIKKINESSKNAFYIKSFDDINNFLSLAARENDVIITMGAGDVYKIADSLLEVDHAA